MPTWLVILVVVGAVSFYEVFYQNLPHVVYFAIIGALVLLWYKYPRRIGRSG